MTPAHRKILIRAKAAHIERSKSFSSGFCHLFHNFWNKN